MAPSLTDTPLAATLLGSDEKRSQASARHPLGRVGNAEEIAACTRFLPGPGAGWTSGHQVLAVAGGLGSLRLFKQTSAMTAYLGVDGCRGGWFGIELGGPQAWRFALVARAELLPKRFPNAALILIDIPIGLPRDCGRPRTCDRLAAQRLGPRRASVFPAPCREILTAPDYPAALALSRRLTGKGISKQAWNIGPKIREVDRWLRADAEVRALVREVHPEVCFQALNGGEAMASGKHKPAGERQRLELLTNHFPAAPVLFEQASRAHPRRLLARDDILDALVNALSACLNGGRLERLPAEPERDDMGLPMEIYYPLPETGQGNAEKTPLFSGPGVPPSNTGTRPKPGS